MPHILFADDHPAVELGFLRMAHLCCPDWQVSQAENGSDAVEQAEHLQPDLIVLDLSMPVMDGLAAARELKTQDAKRAVNTLDELREFQPQARSRRRWFRRGRIKVWGWYSFD